MAQGYGGVTATSAATGLARSTINRGNRVSTSLSLPAAAPVSCPFHYRWEVAAPFATEKVEYVALVAAIEVVPAALPAAGQGELESVLAAPAQFLPTPRALEALIEDAIRGDPGS